MPTIEGWPPLVMETTKQEDGSYRTVVTGLVWDEDIDPVRYEEDHNKFGFCPACGAETEYLGYVPGGDDGVGGGNINKCPGCKQLWSVDCDFRGDFGDFFWTPLKRLPRGKDFHQKEKPTGTT